MTPLVLAPTCVLAIAELELEAVERGWTRRAHLEVVGDGRCPSVGIRLPRVGRIDKLRARVRLSDGGTRRIDEARRDPIVREPDGSGLLVLHTPEVLTGDRVVVDLWQALPPTPIHWDPGTARYASLESSVPFAVDGEMRTSAWWTEAPSAPVHLVHPSPGPLPIVRTLPDVPSRATLDLRLVVPGDPQRSLYPGGGSTYEASWAFEHGAFGPAALVVPLPRDAHDVEVQGPHQRFDDSVLLQIDGPTSHTVRFAAPDAPTHGAVPDLPGADVQLRVSVDDGRIRWEDDRFWWLASIDFRSVTPDRPDLLRALDRRFRRAALPEPAVPVHLRGSEPNGAAVEGLRTALQLRAGVGDLPLAALFPRRLVKARNSGALTSVEAALVLTLQLGQLGARAVWGVVAPGPADAASRSTPEGYTEGVVVVATPGGRAFVDPGCTACAPFEVRPHLQGTVMLSPAGSEGPPIVPGRAQIEDVGDQRRVRLEGPAALVLRLALTEVPPSARRAFLAERFGGADATLVSSTGLSSPGAPILLEVGLGANPPNPLDAVGDAWTGERAWSPAVRPPSPPVESAPDAPPPPAPPPVEDPGAPAYPSD